MIERQKITRRQIANTPPLGESTGGLFRVLGFWVVLLLLFFGFALSASAQTDAIRSEKTVTIANEQVNTWNVTLQFTAEDPRGTSDTLIVVDTSGEADASFAAYQAALVALTDSIFAVGAPGTRIGLVGFNEDATLHQDFVSAADALSLRSAITALTPEEGTNAQAGLHLAQTTIGNSQADRKNIILLLRHAPSASFAIHNPGEYSLNLGSELVTNSIVPEFAFNYDLMISDGQVYPDTAPAVASRAVNSLIAESILARAKSINLYTVSIDGALESKDLIALIGAGSAHETTAIDLEKALREAAAAALGFPSSVTYTEKIAFGFEVPDELIEKIEVSAGSVAYNKKLDGFTWTLDPILNTETRTLKYSLRPTPDLLQIISPTGRDYPTAATSILRYTIANQEPVETTVDIPNVSPVFVRIDNHLLDGLNQIINQPDRKFTLEMASASKTYNVEVGAYETKVLVDIAEAGTYTVREIGTSQGEIEDYAVTITPETFTISPESDPVSVQVINRVKPGGTLIVKQALVDPYGTEITDDARKFNYTVSGPGGYLQEITVSEKEPVTLTNLIYGTYQIEPAKLSAGFEYAGGPDKGMVELADTLKTREVTFVNRFTPEITNVKAKFIWQDGPVTRPEIQVMLFRNDEPVLKQPTTVRNGSPDVIWEDVPATDLHGEPVSYRVALAAKLQDYETTNPEPLTIHNRYVIPTTGAAKATVDWINGPSEHPEIALRLTRILPGRAAEVVPNLDPVVLPNGTVEASWRDLERTSLVGDAYTFGVQLGVMENGVFVEKRLDQYDTRISGLTVVNQYVVRADGIVRAKIEWINGNPATRPTVYARLYRALNDRADARVVPDTEILEITGNMSEFSWNKVEMTTMSGENYLFSVRQVDRTGNPYSPANYVTTEEGLTITNSYIIPTNGEASATVSWVDGPEQKPELSLQLIRSVPGSEAEAVPGQPTVSLSAGADEAEWTGLEETDPNGTPYTFSVRVGKSVSGTFVEGAPDSYTSTVKAMNVVNTYKVATDASAKATIDWINGGAQSRPTVYLQLLRKVLGSEDEALPVPELKPTEIINGEMTASWENLERTDRNGDDYIFSVAQVDGFGRTFTPENYDTIVDGLSVINTYIVPTSGEIHAEVVWDGGPAETRPTVWLKAQRAKAGTAPEDIPSLEIYQLDEDVTTASWFGLDETDLDGNPYIFSIVEGRMDGDTFTASAPESYEKSEDGVTVTNHYIIPADGSATAEIRWENGPENARPTVYLRLYRRLGVAPIEAVPGAELYEIAPGITEVTWDKLEATDRFGEPYVFSVAEVNAAGERSAPENYEVRVKGMTVTNSYVIPADAVVEAKVEWINGSTLKRPVFQLALVRSIQGGEPEIVLSAARQIVNEDMTTVRWEGVESCDLQGNPYTFSVRVVNSAGGDVDIPNYLSEIDGLTVRNQYQVRMNAEATATVTWVNGPAENRPPLWLRLFRQTSEFPTAEIVPDAAILPLESGAPSVTWSGLAATDIEGRPYEFSAHLVNANGEIFFLANYEKTESGLQITNRYIIPTFASATANVSWVDGNANERPDIWLVLTRRTEKGVMTTVPGAEPIKLSHGMTSASWDNLEATDKDGNNYVFGVMETDEKGRSAAPEDYRKTENGLSVVNTYQIPYDYVAQARVVWEGGSLIRRTVYLKLYRRLGENGAIEEAPDAITKTLVNGVTVVQWENLQRTDIHGTAYTYSVRQVDDQGNDFIPPGYETSYDGLRVTNTFIVPKTGSARGVVQWVDGPKDSRPIVWLKLQRRIDNNPPEDVPDTEIKELPNGTTSVEWVELAETDIYGNKYLFTVELVDANGEVTTAPGYTKKLSGQVVINRYIIPTDAVVEGTKIWVDGPEEDRPTTWFRVYRRIGEEAEILIPNSAIVEIADGETKARWEGLEATDANGVPYTFSVREVDSLGKDSVPENYQKVEDGLTVTNTYVIPKKGSAVATIQWVNAPRDVPPVWFKLYRQIEGGTVEEVPDAILKQLNSTTPNVVWLDLEQTDRFGNPYVFSVQEVNAYGLSFVPDGYEKTEDGLTVTNTKK